MDNFSLTISEEKYTNRSDPAKMHNIDYIPLAQLRPEKIDDAAIKKQILIIREACEDINLDVIALVFHECDYNIQNTIARIKAGDYEDGGWQTAKSNNKKKNSINQVDQALNGGMQNDTQHTPTHHRSPTSSLRGNSRRRRRYDHYHSSRAYPIRRGGNLAGRNQFIPANSHYSFHYHTNTNKSKQQNTNERISKKKEETVLTPSVLQAATSIINDRFEFIPGTTQTLIFDNNSLKKSSTKQPTPSAIPQEPVCIHPILRCSTMPIDIQFGDVKWNDSMTFVVSPSDSSNLISSLDDQKSSSVIDIIDNHDEQKLDVQDTLSSSYINCQTNNEIDSDLIETTNRLSSCSISSSSLSLANNSSGLPLEGTSHLSDQLTDSLRQQIATSSTSSTKTLNLLPTSTPNTLDYISSTSQSNSSFIRNNCQVSLSNTMNVPGVSQSAFTPITTAGIYPSTQRDYSHMATNWNSQQSNYKPSSKAALVHQGNYHQQASCAIQHQPPYFYGNYSFTSTAMYPYFQQIDSCSVASPEPYSAYQAPGYLSSYTTQQTFHPTTNPTSNNQTAKYDRSSYEKDIFNHYGQTHLSNSDLTNLSQATKDTLTTSKLSATAASFSQGAPMTATNSATPVYLNPVLYSYPSYYASNQDRTMTYTSVDNRDNRNGASYAGNHNRSYYHHQQRTHNNSTWHSQQ